MFMEMEIKCLNFEGKASFSNEMQSGVNTQKLLEMQQSDV